MKLIVDIQYNINLVDIIFELTNWASGGYSYVNRLQSTEWLCYTL